MQTSLRYSILIAMCIFGTQFVQAQEGTYQLGLGHKVHEKITLGGYFSTEFSKGEDLQEFVLDDVALLAYGDLSDNFSFLAEIESVGFYSYDFEIDRSETNTKPAIERFYTDFKFSDHATVRVGKQITPIGYWNLQPINVLRETTSSPRLSREMFPKFVTGLQISGYTPLDESIRYSVYLQNTGDMDAKYVNIAVDQHYGFSLEKNLSNTWSIGGSAGRFEEINEDRTSYFQLNSRVDSGQYTFLLEAIVDYHTPTLLPKAKSSSIYSQLEYRFQPRHAVIVRAESFRDDRISLHEKIGVLGYSYRPQFPISLKLEYQWHADSDNNRLVGSFSVLF
tara:strand:- start:2992 stop:3999 length:1008 start_codon:yes stop_codon:yes gene_type:complete